MQVSVKSGSQSSNRGTFGDLFLIKSVYLALNNLCVLNIDGITSSTYLFVSGSLSMTALSANYQRIRKQLGSKIASSLFASIILHSLTSIGITVL
jgi:hypothetical protein